MRVHAGSRQYQHNPIGKKVIFAGKRKPVKTRVCDKCFEAIEFSFGSLVPHGKPFCDGQAMKEVRN